jgi:hypothetical protein
LPGSSTRLWPRLCRDHHFRSLQFGKRDPFVHNSGMNMEQYHDDVLSRMCFGPPRRRGLSIVSSVFRNHKIAIRIVHSQPCSRSQINTLHAFHTFQSIVQLSCSDSSYDSTNAS